ncbi:MAG: DUF3575 domain-containing protein [Bacteroidales bacterium]
MKKTFIILLLIFMGIHSYAQTDTIPKVNVKLNSVVVLGIMNPAVEFRVFKKGSVQIEAIGIFAPRNFLGTGYPCSMAVTYGEFRFYPKQVFKGFFCGVHTGWAVYRLNKNLLPIYGYLKDPNSIHVGQALIVGFIVGYNIILNKHWGLEISLGGGRQFSTYESYTPKADGTSAHRELNGSAEYLPTKGGILVNYRF